MVSIETAQSGLALDVLDSLGGKTIILGVIDLSTDEVETPETVEERIRRAFPHAGPERLVAAPGLRHEVPPARLRLREARGARRGRARVGLGTQSMWRTMPPSARSAAPLIADARGLAT